MNSGQHTFTAAQIARAAGLSRQTIYAGLAGITSAAEGWTFASLPLDWQLEITRRGVQRGFENGEQFLDKLPAPWSCPMQWSMVPKRQQEKAVKLQKALARALELRGEMNATPGQVEAAGLEDFKTQFGYTISTRHWRRLLHRTVERDAAEENWQRLEIYLDERTFAVSRPARQVLREEHRHRELDEMISALENRQSPTVSDLEFLWDGVFRHYEQHAEQLTDSPAGNKERRLFKASLGSYLFKAFPAGTICATEKSLRNRFDEKLALWREGGRTPEALRDRRALDSGNFRTPAFNDDLKKIRDLAIQLDGSEALAHRMLRERGQLSKEFCEHYQFDPRSAKSALPQTIRDAITAEVDMTLPLRRGPWQAKMRGPYIPRDWSGVKPGDWFNADDVTWNHAFRQQLPDGRWEILRGECLLMTDLRTGYPLDFLLIPGKYNGEHVRSLVLRVHDRIGLPRNGFYFEKGVWASRLITGDRRQGTPVHWREAENGLCSAGLKLSVRHATTPRAKPIEGLLRILQERMRCIPGFLGFNERTDERERVQEQIARARRGDEAALQQFPTMPEWRDRISTVLNEFAKDPQNGKMLQGAAPAETWAAEVSAHPLKQLANEARFVLSTHQKRMIVRQEGILLTIRGQRHLYYNEHTGPLIGKEVLAFYNLEMPELLTVCDMNRQNYFSVRRVELPAMAATREQLEEVNQLRKAHMAHAKGIFGGLRHEVVSTITRDNEHSTEERDFGRFHNAEVERATVEKSATGRKMRKLQVKLATAGIELSGPVRDVDEALEAAERRDVYLARLRSKEQAAKPH